MGRIGKEILFLWDNDNHENLSGNPPYSQSATIYNTTLTGFTSGAQTLFPPTLAAFDTRKLYPTVSQYSLTVEKQLPGSTAVAAGTVNVNTVRPYEGYAAINYDVRSASANYNSLQADARRHFRSGFLFEAAYIYLRSPGSQVGQSQFVNENGPTAYDRPPSNLFNHPVFNGVGTTVGAATFGKIASALDPRNIAFKLKFSF